MTGQTYSPGPDETDSRAADVVGGLLGVMGALLTVLACALPFGHFPSDSGTASPSIFNPGSADSLWYAAEPVAAALLALIASAFVLFSRRQVVEIIAVAALAAFGVQTFFMFLGYAGYALAGGPDEVGIGGLIGLAAGLCLFGGGLVALVSVAGRMTPLHEVPALGPDGGR